MCISRSLKDMCSIGNFTRRLHAQLPRMVAAVLATAAIVYLLDNITGWRNVTNTTDTSWRLLTSVHSNAQYPHQAVRQLAADSVKSATQTSVGDMSLSLPSRPVTNSSPWEIRSTFQLPMPTSTHSVDTLLAQPWMQELQEILSTIDPHSGPISITTSDYNFRDILLNWLTASMVHISPALSHVLVLCMDESVYSLLKFHGIPCIYAPPDSFTKHSVSVRFKNHAAFSETQILRLIVMRFLNHWGYDVANYDVDAIVARNPEPLYYDTFKDSGVIGSHGNFPSWIGDTWGGSTICGGAFMIKSGPETEVFWRMMNAAHGLSNTENDQERLNTALLQLNLHWDEGHHGDISVSDWQGVTDNGLKVTILSVLKICRHSCHKSHRGEYYVWHKGGSGREGKMRYAKQGRLWFLRSDWEELTNLSSLKGVDWLKAISNPSDQ